MDNLQHRCPCGCEDVPDNGPCNHYKRGGNGRCVWCDHAAGCHAPVEDERKPEENPSQP